LIGANTAVKDNPFLTAHNKGRNPIRAVVDLNLKIPENHHLLDGSIPTVILFDEKVKRIERHFLKDGITLTSVNAAARTDFKIIRDRLLSIGIKTVLIEGGGELIASALFSGCVHDAFFFIAPKIIGGRNAVSAVGGEGVSNIKDALEIENMKVKKIGADLLIHGEIKNRQKR
jgi:diaminohydroxyphosphoribosylaminopyrimidine deaminase/5-amino-6-(5-phosphoribosylamino)uracil reductase